MTNRATIITRVVTEEGIVGEAYAGDEDKTLAEIAAIIEREIAPRLIGEDAFAFERCWELGYPVTYDQLRDRRVGLVALASVDLAIWDAIGKALSVPLWQLWGGYRDTIPVIIIGGYYGRDLAGIRDEVAEWRAMGFRGCKFKVGGRYASRRTPSASRPRARRPATTSSSRSTPTRATACRWRSSCASASPTSTSAGSRSRAAGPTTSATCARCAPAAAFPVCAGQSEHSPEACRDLMEHGAIDVCNFDASWSGGYTNWRRMAAGRPPLQRRSSATTRSRRSRPTCSRASRTAPTSRCSTRTAIRSGGTSSQPARARRRPDRAPNGARASAGTSTPTSSSDHRVDR